jgi:phosphatidylserine decarboxylase
MRLSNVTRTGYRRLLVSVNRIIIFLMRIPLTKYGLPEVVYIPVIIIGLMILILLLGPHLLPVWLVVICEGVFLAGLFLVLNFFRDPYREVPADRNALLAPADGRIMDIEVVEENTFLRGPALRIGIFMDIFNVHINRFPCAAKIEKVTHKPGRYKNAMSLTSSQVNEANDIALARLDEPTDRLLVRQIAGVIARRIVCEARPGQNFSSGQQFGMVKFGSRTELYLPMRQNAKCLVRVGDKVKAGLSILVKYGHPGSQAGHPGEEA